MFDREFAHCSSESGEKNIDTNFAKLKETILNKKEQILLTYSNVERVSMLDIKIFTMVLKAFELDSHIQTFISTILRSKDCIIPSHEEIFRWLILLFNQRMDVVKPFSMELGKPLLLSFVETLFKKVENFEFGSKALVDEGI